MSNQIGELFKILGKNEIFANYAKEIENGKTNKEIIDISLNDETLMSILLVVVSDIEIIKNKMDVIIGQKRKSYEKKISNLVNSSQSSMENDQYVTKEKDEDENNLTKTHYDEFKYNPINPDNVVVSNNLFYMEKVDNWLRLVTREFEFYY